MEIRTINQTLSVTGQIGPDDMAVIAAMGFKSILCNRPDGEDAVQPLFEAVKAAAHTMGLGATYLPVAPSGPTASDVVRFAKAFDALPKPVLAYCRTGNRSQATWAATKEAQAH